jgi:hypothetical protein
MRTLTLLASLLLSACAFDASGQAMDKRPDAGGADLVEPDAGVTSQPDAELTTPPDAEAEPDARELDEEDDHDGPGGGHGPG